MRELQYKNLQYDNYEFINKVNFWILISSIIISIVLSILSTIGFFSVSKHFNVIIVAYSFIATLINILLVKIHKNKSLIAAFFGLAAVEGFITLAGTSDAIGIYITFGIAPIIATLYYNKKFTLKINIISYLLMIVSLYFKWQNDAAIFDNREGLKGFCETYFPVVIGFTIEYIVLFLITMMITERNSIVLKQKTVALDELKASKEKIEEKNNQLEDTQLKIIQFVAQCLGSHDLFTGRHVMHTKEFVYILCKKMRELGYYTEELTDENIDLYSSAAFLHDIGKIHIPEGILNKVGKFTDEEFERMKSHPEEGRKLLEFLPKIGDGKFNDIAIQMAYCHHEKWDGTGYPRRIAGDNIPLCARIMAAADVLDALISQRLYKEPMSIEQALKVFEESKNKHFEACIADAVIACESQIREIDAKFKQAESAIYNQELQWWNNYHQNKEEVKA